MVQKGSKILKREVQNHSNRIENLTQSQKQIYEYLTRDFLTIKQIAIKRKTSLKAVYKIVNKLISMNIIDKNYSKISKVQNLGGGSGSKEKIFRLHGQRFTIEILELTTKYKDKLKIQNKSIIDNNTVQMYEHELVIYSNKDFWGYSVDNCLEQSEIYWNNYIRTLENDLNLILIKPRKCIIKNFGCHIAKTNDILAKEVNLSDENLKVYAPDGKLRLIIDNSFNLNEFEAVHKDTAPNDMRKVELFYKELLEEKNLMTLKDQQLVLQAILIHTNENEKFKAEILVTLKTLITEIERLKEK